MLFIGYKRYIVRYVCISDPRRHTYQPDMSQLAMYFGYDSIRHIIYFELCSSLQHLILSGRVIEGGILPQIYRFDTNKISWRIYAYGNDIFAYLIHLLLIV